MKIFSLFLISIALHPSFWASSAFADAHVPRPRLILTLVIDQFRADYLMRFENRFLPATGKDGEVGGYRYLMSQGAYYPYSQYGLLQSMTGPGHATVLTGAYPYQHGIPINYWYDEEKKGEVYCVEDTSSPVVGVKSKIGVSPKNLLASTVGDELKNAGYGSRVYTVALKDRAAILMGGHRADLAIWFNAEESKWISSKYYLPSGELPPWMQTLNSMVRSHAEELVKQFPVWRPDGPGTGFSTESSLPFAHPLVIGKEEALRSPYGDELTEQAAEHVFDEFSLGSGKSTTDLLAVSFSSHDLVGHEFGPNSREMEEMTISEDRQISRLLNHIRAHMTGGLSDVAIVLTGDHGIPELPEYAASGHFPGGRINDDSLAHLAEEKLDAHFGKAPKGQKWINAAFGLNFYLNHEALAAKKIPLEKAVSVMKTALTGQPGVLYFASSVDAEEGRYPPGLFGQQYEHTRFPGRSADLVIIPKPGFMSGEGYGVNHHTGYSYDRTVPIILAGRSFFKAGVYAQEARVIDIAPTLSFISGTVPPNMSEGRVLSEAIR